MNSEIDSDKRLVERVKRGDKRAFDVLVLKYQHRIANLITRYVRDQDEVLDVTQEVFVKAYRAMNNFRGDAQFYTWLYRIAINTAKNFLVAKSRRPPDTDIDVDEREFSEQSVVISEEGNPEDQLSGEQLKRVLQKALEDLPEELRVALMLREFDGLTYDEIAQIMDCPVGTVRSRIFRGRESIEKSITKMESD
ncbi:MAG: RNA polymerase sigma factor RpoE [Gammaproteobacteria bacterium]|nr:RNA polymerase sigma factor RpoE [Gammaproteobacteria bacterium]MBT5204019.1 RNA polymerase sigma factor RpoE [Gammaproteobacteria bacterium]MBT6243841.1 RNA polymerase sigma factor RpoE [Gammaproteobacteria bacterium]